jgi:protein-disulfide isomerase
MSKSAKPGKDNFTRNLVIAIVVGVIGVMVVPTVISKNSTKVVTAPSSVSKADGNGIAFNSDLKGVPTVDLWEDFQCPICKQFEAVNSKYIDSLITDKKAKVVFHTLSFIGPDSIRAANAGACAADEGKFISLHNALYATQGTENSGAWTNDALVALGKSAGITSSKFASCVKNGDYANWVQSVADDGVKKKVNSTPTVFVNGKEIDRNTEYFNPVKFKAAVERG